MSSSAERQRRFRARARALGVVQITGYVPASQAAAVRRLMEALLENRGLELGSLKDVKTGRYVRYDR